MIIRRETPDDTEAIHALHLAAFARPDREGPAPEARLVRELRADGDTMPSLCLVVERDDQVIGHVMCSRATIGGRPSLALGPIAVHPDCQRQGVGSALMHAVVSAADALDEPTIVLLGHPEYYPRFGFEPAVDHGITPPQDWGPQFFLVRRLSSCSEADQGLFRYPSAFERMG